MVIELHILQNFAPSCLNRDDTGAPKECEFGGHRRARISSQCIKRAIRDYFKDNHLLSEENLAKRTLLIRNNLVKRLESSGKETAQAINAVDKALSCVKLAPDKDGKTKYLIFAGERELAGVADIIGKFWGQLQSKEPTKEFEKELFNVLDGGKAVDLALFGRMIADLPEKNIDAACQIAHAISTNKVNVEFDYFTAVDDLQPEEKTGAGMVGTMEFNSACYYRYANVDLEQLKNNLNGDSQLARQAWQAFLRAAVLAVPTGKQTSMSAQDPPDFVFAVARQHGAWSLANAFARPVYPDKDNSLIQQSVAALISYWNRLTGAYGTDDIKAKPAFSVTEVPLDGLEKVENLDALIAAVDKAVSK